MYDFAYQKPASVADAREDARHRSEAKALAGGQTFIPVLKQRLNKPSAVVDLSGLGLTGITVTGNSVTIGAMTPHGEVAELRRDQGRCCLACIMLASQIGDNAVRHRGTIGGSLANNDPSACYPSAVLALGATIKTDRREIVADDFFQGMFTTALEPGELIVSVTFPVGREVGLREVRQPGLALRHGRRVRRQGSEAACGSR